MPGKSQYYCDRIVKCPYYRKESKTEIKCKGLCGTHTVQIFRDGMDKKNYKDDFCNGLYWNCPVNIALEIDNGEMG